MHRRTMMNACAVLGLTAFALPAVAQQATDPENTLYLDLKPGRVVIEMFPDVAPKHVAQIKTLARQGFYDGTPFHRVIEGFMAQGGDPTGTGTSGSKLPNLPPEFSKRHFVRGVCGMARSSEPDSANSQFFIMFAPAPSLDGQYTIWGRVVRGMEYVDQIKRGTGPGGKVLGEPDRIVHMRVAADVK
jgi:peptidylprolyl isomerase